MKFIIIFTLLSIGLCHAALIETFDSTLLVGQWDETVKCMGKLVNTDENPIYVYDTTYTFIPGVKLGFDSARSYLILDHEFTGLIANIKINRDAVPGIYDMFAFPTFVDGIGNEIALVGNPMFQLQVKAIELPEPGNKYVGGLALSIGLLIRWWQKVKGMK